MPTPKLPALLFVLLLSACGGSAAQSSASPAAPASTPASAPSAASPSTAPPPAQGGKVTAVAEVNATGMGGAFSPATVTVAPGETVRWTNSSGNIHNVTFDSKAIKSSSVMMAGDTFEVTFTAPGNYPYTCTYHPGMVGTVVVR